MKTCCRCKISKPLNAFYARKGVKDGLAYHCKVCQDKMSTNRRRIKEFGIDTNTYVEMVKSRNNCCDICGSRTSKELAIDHCHVSGKVRGLLCGKCNIGLGQFNDSIELLYKAITYLSTQ